MPGLRRLDALRCGARVDFIKKAFHVGNLLPRLGAQRFRQLLRLTWADYDKKAKVLRLIDAKGKRTSALPHYLPVSERVRSLLDELWGLNSAPAVFGPFG